MSGMSTSTAKSIEQVRAKSVRFAGDILQVQLSDGREISLPLHEVPRLKWLANWSVEPGGYAIYWDDLDDGVEVCHLLDAQPIAR